MNGLLRKALSGVVTLAAILVAALILLHLWRYYMDEPWTRDAHVAADVVRVAPDVSGLVVQVDAHDNQVVKAGQTLFVIDPSRYRMALVQAKAALAQEKSVLGELRRQAARDRVLHNLVAGEVAEERRAKIQQAVAAVDEGRNAVNLAQLNLQRTTVKSPVAGMLNDSIVRLGDYVATGRPVLSVIDGSTIRVDAFFEETKLHNIHVGDKVRIHLMGGDGTFNGHVTSIAGGIQNRDISNAGALPNVNPVFNWVRLAQRVPVRIAIDRAPAGADLVVGRTATVIVEPAEAGSHGARASEAR